MLTIPRINFLTRVSTATLLEAVALAGYMAWLASAIHSFATIRPLWYDELFTLHLARAPLADLPRHLANGVDLNPPLSYIVTHLVISLGGEAPGIVRLPALLGLLMGLMCLYAVLRSYSRPTALVGIMASVASVKVWIYFMEARPYGLMFGFAGLALLAWHRRWMFTLAFAAVCGVLTHYYFVTVLAALGVAEVWSQIRNRQWAWKPWLALACGGLALAACYPLWSVAPREYAAGFWAKATFSRISVQDTLTQFVEPTIVLPVLLSICVCFISNRKGITPIIDAPGSPIPFVALALTPILGVALGALLTGGFYFRYVLPAALGFGALFALALHRIAMGQTWPLVVSALLFAGFGLPYSHKPFREFFRHESNLLQQQITVLNQHAAGKRVVVETGFDFGRLWQANAPAFRVAFAADPELAMRYAKTDTTERAVLKLKAVTAVPVLTMDELEAAIHNGGVCYFGPHTAWCYQELRQRGYVFEKLAEHNGNQLSSIHVK